MICILLTEDEVKSIGVLEVFVMQKNLRQNILEHLNMLLRNGVYKIQEKDYFFIKLGMC